MYGLTTLERCDCNQQVCQRANCSLYIVKNKWIKSKIRTESISMLFGNIDIETIWYPPIISLFSSGTRIIFSYLYSY